MGAAFLLGLGGLVATVVITCMLTDIKEALVAQTEDLRAAIGDLADHQRQLGVDLGEAVDRVEAKLAALGEPDPDLTADIASIRGVSDQLADASSRLDALAAGPPDTSPGGGTGTPPDSGP